MPATILEREQTATAHIVSNSPRVKRILGRVKANQIRIEIKSTELTLGLAGAVLLGIDSSLRESAIEELKSLNNPKIKRWLAENPKRSPIQVTIEKASNGSLILIAGVLLVKQLLVAASPIAEVALIDSVVDMSVKSAGKKFSEVRNRRKEARERDAAAKTPPPKKDSASDPSVSMIQQNSPEKGQVSVTITTSSKSKTFRF